MVNVIQLNMDQEENIYAVQNNIVSITVNYLIAINMVEIINIYQITMKNIVIQKFLCQSGIIKDVVIVMILMKSMKMRKSFLLKN